MITIFLFVAVVSSIFSYISMDPMKSSFFLIFSLLSCVPAISFSLHIWFSYFICLLFLSGIFVILVYFSSLSKISVVKSHLVILVLTISIFFVVPNYCNYFGNLSFASFYYSIYWFVFIFIILCLLFFMNFSSYFLNFSGALRKI